MKYMQDFQDMSMFLGTHNHSRSALKEALQEISGYEEVLCDIYDVALKIVDTPAYIKHQDKHSLLKVYTNLCMVSIVSDTFAILSIFIYIFLYLLLKTIFFDKA